MRVDVDVRLAYRFREPTEVLLLLEAAEGPDQAVVHDLISFNPALETTRRDAPSGRERRLIFTGAGDVELLYAATVDIAARDARLLGRAPSPIRDLPAEVLPFLRPSRYCPSDQFEDFVGQTFGGLEAGARAHAIVEWVRRSISYQPGVSNAASTAIDTFVDRAGVCRDFTHLAISLCRAADIPARAVSAHAWKLDPPDMHAVVEIYLDGAWRLADPTGLAPVDGLVRVATGRDAADIAFMSIFGKGELIEQSFQVMEARRPDLRTVA